MTRYIAKFILTFVLAIYFANASYSNPQKLEPVILSVDNIDSSNIEINFSIADGWKLYAHEIGDVGKPLTIELKNTINIKSHHINWPSYKTSKESVEGAAFINNYYETNLLLPISFAPLDDSLNINTQLQIEYSACKDYCINGLKKIDIHLGNRSAITEYISIILIAILGGFLLNLMPCVLPILSLKIMSLIKHSEYDERTKNLNLWATTCGVIFSFMLIAFITILIQQAGNSVGWGMHFQQPLFVMFLALMLVLFSSNLWGDFEITLPAKIADNIPNIPNGLAGSFLSGAFATLFATPCTISLISTVVAYAITRSAWDVCLIYFLIGIGMSLPYLLLICFPSAYVLLPKPGAWMTGIKKLFSLMLMATAFWMLYILSNQIHIRALLVFICGIILIKFFIARTMNISWKTAVISLSLIATFYLPINLNSQIEKNDLLVNSTWEKFDEKQLLNYVDQNRVVLVDFTAEWCATCKVNKFLVLDNQKFISATNTLDVVLMRADLTSSNLSQDNPYVRFLAKHKRYGIPFNAIFSNKNPQGIIMPTLLSKNEVIDLLIKEASSLQ